MRHRNGEEKALVVGKECQHTMRLCDTRHQQVYTLGKQVLMLGVDTGERVMFIDVGARCID